MSEPNTPTESDGISKSSWGWYSNLMLIPLLGLVAVVATTISELGPPTLFWGGVKLVVPVSADRSYRIDQRGFFELKGKANILAGIAGNVETISGREFKIVSSNQQQRVTMRYLGVDSLKVVSGTQIEEGEVVAVLDAGKFEQARLEVQVFRGSEQLTPPFAERFQSASQAVATLACNGCHQLRGVTPLTDGKMLDGTRISAASLARSIREGGMHKGPFGMPQLDEKTLPEIKDLVAYLCGSQCADLKTFLASDQLPLSNPKVFLAVMRKGK